MNNYYLFIIRIENINLYRRKSYVLYKLLENLYRLNSYDFYSGFNVYNKLCNNFSVKLLNNYVENRIRAQKIKLNTFKIELKNEQTYFKIMYPCIVIRSNLLKPTILKIFNIYNRNIFMCNFEKKDYVWLNNYIKK